jgi:hypothetical protein
MSSAERRDRLTQLGDQLDAAQKASGKVPARLFKQYRTMLRERAEAAPLPKVTIKIAADFWRVNEMLNAAFARYRDLKAEFHDMQFREDGVTFRQMADVQATLWIAQREWLHIAARINAHAARKANRKTHWQRVRQAERNSVKTGEFTFPVVVQMGRQS